jgi:hypothetical protein
MGHLTLSGRVTKPGDNGGLWQIDIPDGRDTFHTEFFGSQSVYRIRMVSEEIARAYVSNHEVISYDAPIITRAEHEAAMDRAREMIEKLRRQLAVATLGPGEDHEVDDDDPDDDDGDPPF